MPLLESDRNLGEEEFNWKKRILVAFVSLMFQMFPPRFIAFFVIDSRGWLASHEIVELPAEKNGVDSSQLENAINSPSTE